MPLSDYRETYYEASAKAGDVARQLAFAGIAVVWLFRLGQDSGPAIPQPLILPAILLVLSLGFDLLQYITATIVWGIFQWCEDRKLNDPKDDPDIDSPNWLPVPQFILFWSKLVCVVAAYLLLIKYLGGRLL